MTEDDVESVHEELVRAGVLVKAALSGPEERAWLDCDLASLAENRLGDLLDPRSLDPARRADWLARAVDERPASIARRSRYERCYWIVQGGQRVGTMALALDAAGSTRLHLASFYVLPPFRGRGVGRRAMTTVMAVLGKHGLGLRLDTSWCWQRTVRFYLSLGLWVYMWKRELTLCWDARTPPPIVEIGEHSATLSVARGDSHLVLTRAQRRGDVLDLEKEAPGLDKEEHIGEALWHSRSTLALALALEGWPLIRSPEDWERSYYADTGAPEALAYKITIWEAQAQARGRLVATPRIPGLAYPTWEELEARWEAETREVVLPVAIK